MRDCHVPTGVSDGRSDMDFYGIAVVDQVLELP
jgi:hypothetical protein